MDNVTFVIPAYNEEAYIKQMISKIKNKFEDMPIIVVNDGSTDNTAELIKSFDNIILVNNQNNRGYGASIKIGTGYAKTDYIMTLDADGQHTCENVYKILERFSGDKDMIIGARKSESYQTFLRRPLKYILKIIAEFLVGMEIPDINSGLRLVRKNLILNNRYLLPNGYSLSTTITLLLLKYGYNVEFVPITTKKRVGKSNVNFIRDGAKTILLILRIIMKINPLKIFAPVSGFLFLVGLFFLIKGVFLYVNIPDVSVLLILSSLQVLFLGLLAEQIALRNIQDE